MLWHWRRGIEIASTKRKGWDQGWRCKGFPLFLEFLQGWVSAVWSQECGLYLMRLGVSCSPHVFSFCNPQSFNKSGSNKLASFLLSKKDLCGHSSKGQPCSTVQNMKKKLQEDESLEVEVVTLFHSGFSFLHWYDFPSVSIRKLQRFIFALVAGICHQRLSSLEQQGEQSLWTAFLWL